MKIDGFLKRSFDIIASFLGLVMLSPLLFLIVILIKSNSSGPIFYRGERVGRFGKPFNIFKFRTMVVDAEKIGGPSTSDDDPRVTKIGRFLRDYKLDELPQFINVLKGEMSFVGPRPDVRSEVKTYTEEQKRILSVRPGITDWASLTFHNEGEILKGSSDPHKTYLERIKPKKLELALKYVDQSSFFVDIKIIAQTIRTLVRTRS